MHIYIWGKGDGGGGGEALSVTGSSVDPLSYLFIVSYFSVNNI